MRQWKNFFRSTSRAERGLRQLKAPGRLGAFCGLVSAYFGELLFTSVRGEPVEPPVRKAIDSASLIQPFDRLRANGRRFREVDFDIDQALARHADYKCSERRANRSLCQHEIRFQRQQIQPPRKALRGLREADGVAQSVGQKLARRKILQRKMSPQ